MSSGRKIALRGFTLDKSGKRIKRDPSKWDVSKQLRKKAGAQKVRYGRRAGDDHRM